MATNVYIDGFNLYYGALKRTHFRWLDLEALCQNLLPNDSINEVDPLAVELRGGLLMDHTVTL